MTREEISAAVCALAFPARAWGDWREATEDQKQEYKQQVRGFHASCERVCRMLRDANDPDVLDVLLTRACALDAPPDFGLQNIAEHLLLCTKPHCPISCREACRLVSRSNWNVSIEEVPWYLVSCFGTDAVFQSVSELEQESDVQEAQATVEAYWSAVSSPTKGIDEYMRREREAPRNAIGSTLDTIRYWTKIIVRGDDVLSQWVPFWR